jgi:hypothetical protein
MCSLANNKLQLCSVVRPRKYCTVQVRYVGSQLSVAGNLILQLSQALQRPALELWSGVERSVVSGQRSVSSGPASFPSGSPEYYEHCAVIRAVLTPGRLRPAFPAALLAGGLIFGSHSKRERERQRGKERPDALAPASQPARSGETDGDFHFHATARTGHATTATRQPSSTNQPRHVNLPVLSGQISLYFSLCLSLLSLVCSELPTERTCDVFTI